ncbi:amidohydrolase family protein [Legionella hackeliae]|nr:hypothetical protein [Legionella hackeliae]
MSLTAQQIIDCRSKPLSQSETAFFIDCFASKKDKQAERDEKLKSSPYYQELFETFQSQLLEIAGIQCDIVTQKAHALTRHFLKRKLGLIIPPPRNHSPEQLFDPHHHFNSIYVQQHPTLRYLLPDFGKIYVALRSKDKPFEIENAAIHEDEIKDVQHLANPPRAVKDKNKTQKFFRTAGYVRGGHHRAIQATSTSVDYCGIEQGFDSKDIDSYLSLAKNARVIRFHMGETIIPEQGKRNVKKLLTHLGAKSGLEDKTIRIGHGTHMSIESMIKCAQKGYFIECCLSSNKETGVIEKRHDYPLAVMLLLGVKVVLGTDGGEIYYTDLRKEYGHAEEILARVQFKILNNSQDTMSLPNGDRLKFKHIKHLYNEVIFEDEHLITYADLGKISGIQDILNLGTLFTNMNDLKAKIATPTEKSVPAVLKEKIADLKKENLTKMVEQLIQNISEGQGTRWTSAPSSTKVTALKELKVELEATSDWDSEIQAYYINEVRNICQRKRHVLHFWAIPESVFEFESMLTMEDSTKCLKLQG